MKKNSSCGGGSAPASTMIISIIITLSILFTPLVHALSSTEDNLDKTNQTYYVNDMYEEEVIFDGKKIIKKHIYLGNQKIATIRTVLSPEGEVLIDNEITYHHPDHLGSSSITSDQDGNIVEDVRYAPFGEVRKRLDSLSEHDLATNPELALMKRNNLYLYNNKELDNTGLYYYGSRYYDPVSGLFLLE